MLGEGCPRPQEIVRQYAEQSSAQISAHLGLTDSNPRHHHHHLHHHPHHSHNHQFQHNHNQLIQQQKHHTTASPTSSCNNNNRLIVDQLHNHLHPHIRSNSIDRYNNIENSLSSPLLSKQQRQQQHCPKCQQQLLFVSSGRKINRRSAGNGNGTIPTNVKLKEWFTTINHKWARIKRQVILHHQRQQPLINEDNYGTTGKSIGQSKNV